MFSWFDKFLWITQPPVECYGSRLHVQIGNENVTIVTSTRLSHITVALRQHRFGNGVLAYDTELDGTVTITVGRPQPTSGTTTQNTGDNIQEGGGIANTRTKPQIHTVDTTTERRTPVYTTTAHLAKVRATINVPLGMLVTIERI